MDKKSNSALLAGILIGAAVATAAIGYFVTKTYKTVQAHLFDLEKQEGKEEQIDSLIPNPDDGESEDKV